ncbi:nucleoside 2-deoxyribosyltransferase [Rhodoplanes sp. SY1]|uniref:nucleoside 2-deoxyribosyltransferase n=1 Tax=Rhodoplanes sp. SY1 TaxID=3166646 RepID=UPI0038B601D2
MIYLAGPDVFLPDAAAIGRRKVALCARYGLAALHPLDEALGPDPASDAIFAGNLARMDRAAAVIADLTPFRGPSADAGTVFELGYMAGRGKLCLGYSNDPRPYAGRVVADGHLIEDFGLADNLMIAHALDRFGAPIVVPKSAPADLFRDLTAFETCVRLVAARLVPPRSV